MGVRLSDKPVVGTVGSSKVLLVDAAGLSLINPTDLPGGSGGGGGSGANLSFTRDATTVTVASDTGTDAVLPAASSTLAGVMPAADKAKLDGVAAGATANSPNATLLARANHTGTQAISTVAGLDTALAGKQAALVSGTNIKTVNGQSLLGSGDLTIEGGGGVAGPVYTMDWATDIPFLRGKWSDSQPVPLSGRARGFLLMPGDYTGMTLAIPNDAFGAQLEMRVGLYDVTSDGINAPIPGSLYLDLGRMSYSSSDPAGYYKGSAGVDIGVLTQPKAVICYVGSSSGTVYRQAIDNLPAGYPKPLGFPIQMWQYAGVIAFPGSTPTMLPGAVGEIETDTLYNYHMLVPV